MAEVIDLCSSSPLRSPALPAPSSPQKYASTAAEEIVSFCLDDFSSVGDLSFSLPTSSSKRRKLNAPSINAPSGRNSRATSLQPAFENNGPPLTGSIIPKQFKVTKSMEHETSDSITFSSSAPQPTRKKTTVTVLDLSDDLPDDIFDKLLPSASQPDIPTSSRATLAERTANILSAIPKISKDTASKAPPRRAGQFRMVGASAAGASVVDEIFSSSPPRPLSAKNIKSKISEEEKPSRATEHAAAKTSSKTAKDANKEAEKERKRLEKAEKTKEKQKADDIAEVNKKKTDKKTSASEMILDISRGFEGQSAGNQVEEYMKALEVQLRYFDEEIDLSASNESVFVYPGNIFKWRRKVGAQYNEDEGQWEPIARPRIEQEKHVLIHLTAVEFATIAAQPANSNVPLPVSEATMKANLDKHILHLRALVKDGKPVYLIEGLDAWLRKNATAKNRVYTAAVRAQDESSSQIPSCQAGRPKKRKKASLPALNLSHIDVEVVERLQLHLQLHPLRPLIHLSTSATDTATWIKSFTEHISTIPYRLLKLQDNLSSASFCMDSGQVKTGENAQDTYIRMLQEVQRVTPSMAYGIAAKYANVKTLVSKFKRDGPLMLEDVKKSANKDGALSDRRLGPQVSKRLYKVFTGIDPGSTDGIA